MPVTEYKSQHRGGMGVMGHKTKEEDFVDSIYVTSSHDDLLCFSSLGKVYTIKAYEVPEAQKQAKGRAMVNLLQIDNNERITTIIPLSSGAEGNLMMATKQGLIKKTPVSEFASIRKGGKIAIKLNEGDELVGVYLTSGKDEVIIASSTGKCIRFSETTVRSMGRDTLGVKSMSIDEGEYIVDMAVLKEGHDMLTISENGYGKRSDADDYRLQGRNGKGIKAGIFNEVTGGLVALKQVREDDDIMMIADDGVLIRVKASEISKIGRNTKGVRIMKIKEGSKIVAVMTTDAERIEEEIEMVEEKVEKENQENIVSTATEIVEDATEEQIDEVSEETEDTEI
jgi:DNA gyrase subunit A